MRRLTTTAASYTPPANDLAGSTTYYWEVQALAPAGSSQNGTWSSVSSFTAVAADFSLSVSPTSVSRCPGKHGHDHADLNAHQQLLRQSEPHL